MSVLWKNMTNFSFLPKYLSYFKNGTICTLVIAVLSVFRRRAAGLDAGSDAPFQKQGA